MFEIDTVDSPTLSVLEFLDRHLPEFPKTFKQLNATAGFDGEDDISQQLCIYLQRLTYQDGVFMFHFQDKVLKKNRSSDFGALTVENYDSTAPSKSFFVIEAKRLPTPGKTKSGKSREREYVEGSGGGIQRFKTGDHGPGLSVSAIFGYVQEGNCEQWHQKINEWIQELIESETEVDLVWEEADLLNELQSFGRIRKYHSLNSRDLRVNRTPIRLYHYLIELPVEPESSFDSLEKRRAIQEIP